jgi:hypothetical protein
MCQVEVFHILSFGFIDEPWMPFPEETRRFYICLKTAEREEIATAADFPRRRETILRDNRGRHRPHLKEG